MFVSKGQNEPGVPSLRGADSDLQSRIKHSQELAHIKACTSLCVTCTSSSPAACDYRWMGGGVLISPPDFKESWCVWSRRVTLKSHFSALKGNILPVEDGFMEQ